MNQKFAEYAARILADAPPMTAEQGARISALLMTARIAPQMPSDEIADAVPA